MKRRVQTIANEMSRRMAEWDAVAAIALGEAAQIETFDPYFTIDIDVYHRDGLPSVEERRLHLGNPAAFEPLDQGTVDTFLQDDLPVRIRYTAVSRIELNLTRVQQGRWVYRDSGTNLFYRIQHAQVLHDARQWLDETRTRLQQLPDDFWQSIRTASRAAVEQALQDLNAAVYRDDDVYYVRAFSGFVRSLCSFLFAVNHHFDPNGRLLNEQLAGLQTLPSEFAGRFESLLRRRNPLEPEQQREVAELLARSILTL